MGDAYTRLYVHLTWSTWNRGPLITEENEPILYRAMISKSKELGCSVLAIGGYYEHVHLLLKFPTTQSLAFVVRALKGVSSYVVAQKDPTQRFRWQSGYGAFTLRDTDIPIVKRYIENQKQHHNNDTTRLGWERSRSTLDPAPGNEGPGERQRKAASRMPDR